MKTVELSRSNVATEIQFTITDSVLGRTLVAATETGICAVFFGDDDDVLVTDLHHRFRNASMIESDSKIQRIVKQVVRFVNKPTTSWQLPLDIRGTEFQRQVWNELSKIPYGQTTTYSQIAARIGNPQSVRAVASACGANPISVIIPCHRVVRSDGTLSGYRWGVERKRKLLVREQS